MEKASQGQLVYVDFVVTQKVIKIYIKYMYITYGIVLKNEEIPNICVPFSIKEGATLL